MTAPRSAPVRATVEDASQVPGARALAVQAARGVGLSPAVVDQVSLVATELAENLHRHAVGGELLVIPPHAGNAALCVIAVDRGPGVEHFERCLVDGFTTKGTLGTGLGAAQRQASDFDAVSEAGVGTAVCASFALPGAAADARGFEIGAIGFPIPGEDENGDAFAVARIGSRLLALAADGLGHGPDAAVASAAATALLAHPPDHWPGALLGEVNEELAATRGAAVSVVSLEIDSARSGGEIVCAGLGNVSVVVAGPDGTTKRVATSHGTAGTRLRTRISEQHPPFPAQGVVVIHTDGLTSRWSFEGRSALLRHSAELIAATLWRDYSRGTDDSMVVVIRASRQHESS